MEILDSGQRKEFQTGAVRDMQEGKGRFDLLPVDAMFELAKHFEAGCLKYGDRNWEKGIPLSRYMDSAFRHMFKLMRGDKDEPHAAAALWNIACFIETKSRITRGLLPSDLDDMPCGVKE